MKNNYEILLALNVVNQEEVIKELLDRIEKVMTGEGVDVRKIDHLERREFSYPHRHLKSAYYVNIIAAAEPSAIDPLRKKLSLIDAVSLQNYYRK